MFSLPSGASSAKLRFIRWTFGEIATPLEIHITQADHITELAGSPIMLPSDPSATGCPPGWGATCFGLDVTSFNFVVTGDFFVIIQQSPASVLSRDNGACTGRSYEGSSLAGLSANSLSGHCNELLRVDVDPTSTPIPEYPIGLTILAIFMVIGYGLIKRRTITY